MAMAARMPMIATTIISSIRVKPRWFPKFRCRLFQNRIIQFSLVVLGFLPDCSHVHPPRGAGAFLGGGRKRRRRSAGLREAERDESKGACFQRDEASGAGFGPPRCPRGRRVVGGNRKGENFNAPWRLCRFRPHNAG